MRVAIIAQVKVLREGLTEILSQAGVTVVLQTDQLTQDVLTSISNNCFDAVLVDASLTDHLQLAQMILEHLNVKVIAFGLSTDENDIRACINAGYCGCVPMDHGREELILALRDAVFGTGYFPADESTTKTFQVAESGIFSQREAANLFRITKRETEILRLLGTGLSNKQIASELHIEVSTVKNHVHNLFDKLNVRRRSEAAVLARQFRL